MAITSESAAPRPDGDPAVTLGWLAQASDLLQGAFENAPVGLFLTDPTGAVQWCNATWRRQLDVWGPTPVGFELWLHLLDDNDRAAVANALRAVTAGNAVVDVAVRCQSNRDESPRVLRLLAGRADGNAPDAGIVGALIPERTVPR